MTLLVLLLLLAAGCWAVNLFVPTADRSRDRCKHDTTLKKVNFKKSCEQSTAISFPAICRFFSFGTV